MLVFSTHAFTEGDVAVGVGVGMAAISTHAFTEGDLIRVQILLVDCEKTALKKTIWHITVITFGYVPFVI